MITLLTGDNSFEIERALNKIADEFNGEVERLDGENLQLKQLADILMGTTLFANARTILIRNLSNNKPIWSILPDWIERISDDIHLILIEPKPDKRTATYKALKKVAKVSEFSNWGPRDTILAEKWVVDEAKRHGLQLDKKLAQQLVNIVGLDQWQLFYAIKKLALLDEVTPEIIDNVIDRNPSDNAFDILETAIKGDVAKLQTNLNNLKMSSDPYQLFGLLSSQVFQIVVVANAGKDNNVASDFGIHPFVVSKMSQLAKKLSKKNIAKIVDIFVNADISLKTSATDPWGIIENALLKICEN